MWGEGGSVRVWRGGRRRESVEGREGVEGKCEGVEGREKVGVLIIDVSRQVLHGAWIRGECVWCV